MVQENKGIFTVFGFLFCSIGGISLFYGIKNKKFIPIIAGILMIPGGIALVLLGLGVIPDSR